MEIPNCEVKPKRFPRRFTVKYKMEIVKEAESCKKGELAVMLRREGLYYSDVKRWCRQHNQGILDGLQSKKKGRKVIPVNPLQMRVKELEDEKAKLEKKLRQAEKIIEFQKKIAELLEVGG